MLVPSFSCPLLAVWCQPVAGLCLVKGTTYLTSLSCECHQAWLSEPVFGTQPQMCLLTSCTFFSMLIHRRHPPRRILSRTSSSKCPPGCEVIPSRRSQLTSQSSIKGGHKKGVGVAQGWHEVLSTGTTIFPASNHIRRASNHVHTINHDSIDKRPAILGVPFKT